MAARLKLLLEILALTAAGAFVFILWPQSQPPTTGVYIPLHSYLNFDQTSDRDSDGLSDVQEEKIGTDPLKVDTDDELAAINKEFS